MGASTSCSPVRVKRATLPQTNFDRIGARHISYEIEAIKVPLPNVTDRTGSADRSNNNSIVSLLNNANPIGAAPNQPVLYQALTCT